MSSSRLVRRPGLLLAPALLLAALAVAAAGCGGGGDKEEGGATTPATNVPITVDIGQDDNFFQPNRVTAAPGQSLTFNVTNGGAAIHNMHIAGDDNEYGANICEAGGEEPCSDPATMPAGSTATLEWTAPSQPGTYDFRCDFHPTEMTGAISVEG
jgi:plastocyanin